MALDEVMGDLVGSWERERRGIVLDDAEATVINHIVFADNIWLICETEEDLLLKSGD